MKLEKQTNDEIVVQEWHKKVLDEELELIEKGKSKAVSLKEFKVKAKKHL